MLAWACDPGLANEMRVDSTGDGVLQGTYYLLLNKDTRKGGFSISGLYDSATWLQELLKPQWNQEESNSKDQVYLLSMTKYQQD